MSELGNKIRQLRGDLTQLDFARKVKLSHRTVTKIEAGEKPRRANLLQIAERMRVAPAERLELLTLWLKEEVGPQDYELLNPQPTLHPTKPSGSVYQRLMKAAAGLTVRQQEQLYIACQREHVIESLTSLNKLYDSISNQG